MFNQQKWSKEVSLHVEMKVLLKDPTFGRRAALNADLPMRKCFIVR